MFVSVALQNSTRKYDKLYDYRVPEELEAFVQPGVRVIVPFGKGRRICEAFVMEVKDAAEYEDIKEICQVIDETPVLTPELIELSKYMKKRYICTYGLAIRCMLPTGLGLLFSEEVRLVGDYVSGLLPDDNDIIKNRDEREIINTLVCNKGKLPIDQLQEILKKPVMKLLRKLEEKHIVEIVNRFQLKAKAKTIKVALPVPDMDEFQEMADNNQIRNMNYLRLMEMLYEEGAISVNELNMLGFSNAVLKNMEKKGLICFHQELIDRNPLDEIEVQKTGPLEPTPCQKDALKSIFECLDSGSFGEILLHGVTGSGKTEVYLQVIAEVIDKGKNAIMLVPEIGLTPQTVRRFKERFGDRIAVLHSRLSMGEKFDQWNRIKNGEIKVVVGARSAIFAPLSNIGIIIIDEEHESSYKSDKTPKYDARTIAAARARYHNAVVLYGSATPSVENYWRAASGKIKLVEMLQRANNQPLPDVITVDMRNEMDKGVRNDFSGILAGELRKNKEAGEKTILFINRRGHSNFILCRECGFISVCPYCSVSLTWHQAEKRLVCHYCGYATIKPVMCPKCGKARVEPYGIGTQKVEERIPEIDPSLSAIRMDFDTTGGKHGHQKILDAFRQGNIDVLIGTQMIAKGHDFPDVTLVGIMSADSLLGSGDYRAAEKTFQLITQASGRAGRAGKPGRVVLQTYNPDEFSIQAAIRQDYKQFYRQEIELRRELQLPPFYQFGLIQVSGKNKDTVQMEIRKIYKDILERKEMSSGIYLSEPSPSPVAKIKNKFRWRILLKHPSIKSLGRILEWVSDSYCGRAKEWTVSVDINPVNMI